MSRCDICLSDDNTGVACEDCSSDPDEFVQMGRVKERSGIVTWLRSELGGAKADQAYLARVLKHMADCIEGGEHIKETAPAAKVERETVWRVICNVTGKLKLDADFPTRGDAQCAAKFLKRWHLRRVTRRRAPR